MKEGAVTCHLNNGERVKLFRIIQQGYEYMNLESIVYHCFPPTSHTNTCRAFPKV